MRCSYLNDRENGLSGSDFAVTIADINVDTEGFKQLYYVEGNSADPTRTTSSYRSLWFLDLRLYSELSPTLAIEPVIEVVTSALGIIRGLCVSCIAFISSRHFRIATQSSQLEF